VTHIEREHRLADGRTLGYALFGAPEGEPFFYFHGFPSSRLEAALHDAAAASSGVRLIAPDRPGFGRSAHRAGRRLADWPNDVRELADHLGLDRFGVVGASCGGPYAAACAAGLPERVRSLTLLGSVAPFTERALTRRQMAPLRLLFGVARASPALVFPLLALDARLLRRDPERAMQRLSKLLSAPDRDLLADGAEARSRFAATLQEAYVQGVRGAAQDAHLLARDWGVDLRAIEAPALVFQGGLDRHAPPEMGRWLARAIPSARLIEAEGDGHLSLICRRLPEALAMMDR